jgi:thiosulfate/3-mercaptopyruvate sulfurtransferase
MSEKVLVSPAELAAMAERGGVVIIGTRAPEAYAAGHIPGAVNIHSIFTYLATSMPEGMATLRQIFADAFSGAGLCGEETGVFYEESMSSGFGQSYRGYFLPKFLGYPKATALHGGLVAWRAAGLPLSTEIPVVQPRTFPVSDSALSMMIDRDEMLKAIAEDRIVKLDVRDVDEWIADSSSPYGKDFCPRKGRIPGARWLEWYRLMKPTPAGPMSKSRDEILAECHSVGVAPETPVYTLLLQGRAGVELAGGAEGSRDR